MKEGAARKEKEEITAGGGSDGKEEEEKEWNGGEGKQHAIKKGKKEI